MFGIVGLFEGVISHRRIRYFISHSGGRAPKPPPLPLRMMGIIHTIIRRDDHQRRALSARANQVVAKAQLCLVFLYSFRGVVSGIVPAVA